MVWIFCEGNDLITNLPIEEENPLLRRYLEPGFRQGLMSRQEEVDSFWRRRVSALKEERGVRSRRSTFRLTVHGWMRLRTLRQLAGLQFSAVKRPDFSGVDPVRNPLIWMPRLRTDPFRINCKGGGVTDGHRAATRFSFLISYQMQYHPEKAFKQRLPRVDRLIRSGCRSFR